MDDSYVGHEMDMEFLDRIAREHGVPSWWSSVWDLGLLWSSWAPPRVRNAGAQRLAALIPPGIRDDNAKMALWEIAGRTQRSPKAVLQQWLFPEGIRIMATDATAPFTGIEWVRLSPSPKAYFIIPSLALTEKAGQWLLQAARNDARRNLRDWAPDGPHGRRRPEDKRPWTEVRARKHKKVSGRRPGHGSNLSPPSDLSPETLVEIQDLLQALMKVASPKERQVLELLRSGDCQEDITTYLGMDLSTVDVHCSNLRRKCAQL